MSRLTEDERALAQHFVPLALRLTRFYALQFPEVDREELKSAALLALTESAARYEPFRGVSFARYSRPRIVGALKDCVREAYSQRSRTVGIVIGVVDRSPPAELVFEAVEEFDRLVSSAPLKYQRLLRLIFEAGLTQAEAGRELGLSQPQVSACLADALMCLADETPLVRFRPRRRHRRARRA